MYGMLPSEGVRLPDGGGFATHGGVHRHDCRRVREKIRLSDLAANSVTSATGRHVPISGRKWMLDPSRQADAVPHLSVLARTDRKQAGGERKAGLLARQRAVIEMESAKAQAAEMRQGYPAMYE